MGISTNSDSHSQIRIVTGQKANSQSTASRITHFACDDNAQLTLIFAPVAADAVFATLRSLGVVPGDELSTRLKTNATIIDKLRRSTRLSSMQDLAGARVTRRMSLSQQDEFVAAVTRRFVGLAIGAKRYIATQRAECASTASARAASAAM